jgi:DNA-binding transcriptional regulator YiaG
MSNLLGSMKDLIRRLARKEIREQVGGTKQSVVRYRSEIAKLKQQLGEQSKQLSRLQKQVAGQEGQPADEEDPLADFRFSARSVQAQRRRLGLSASDYGKIVGVSGLSIYKWEQGKARPRKAQMAALVAVRGIGKREALKRLAEIEQAAKKPRKKAR